MRRARSTIAAAVAGLLVVVLSPGIARADPSTQKWYMFENSETTHWASVANGSSTAGAKAIQWSGPYAPGTLSYRTEEEWRVWDPDGDDWFYLINARSQMVMGVSGGATANGSGIIQWTRVDGNYDQQWTFVSPGTPLSYSNLPRLTGTYLKNRKSNRCLAVAGGDDHNDKVGDQLVIWDCNNTGVGAGDRIWWVTDVTNS